MGRAQGADATTRPADGGQPAGSTGPTLCGPRLTAAPLHSPTPGPACGWCGARREGLAVLLPGAHRGAGGTPNGSNRLLVRDSALSCTTRQVYAVVLCKFSCTIWPVDTNLPLIPTLSLVLVIIGTAYNLFFAPSRADRKEMERRVAKLELDDANHEVRLQGFGQQLEKVSDESDRRCKAIEGQLMEVGRIREDLAGIKMEIKHVMEGYTKLERKIDQLLELRR